MSQDIEKLVYQVVFEKDAKANKTIRKIAKEKGVIIQSSQKLYQARAKGEWQGFTVPAINIRTLTFDVAKVIFREALKKKAGALIIELARSEISYTSQAMSEFVPVILAAAITEGYKGPVFVQADHFQIKAKKYFDPDKKEEEISSLKDLIKDSIKAGVYNIDIDASTLVRLESPDLKEQQKYNSLLTAELTSYIRSLQPKGMTLAVGGEVGEVGKKNSSPEEVKVFMEEYNKNLAKLGVKPGLIKLSVQTGATHGGIVLPSGKIKKVEIDFDTLKKLSKEARRYGLAGAVQHGASTLPEEYFDEFPKSEAVEIHLATAFQNIIYDHMPEPLVEKLYNWLRKEKADERKPEQTEEQFLYTTRKRALGPFKKEIWDMPKANKDKAVQALEDKFSLLFDKLKISNTSELISKLYKS